VKPPNSVRLRRMAEASEWLVRLKENAANEEVLSAWLRWCERDQANAEAFNEMQKLWHHMDEVHPQLASPSLPEEQVAENEERCDARQLTPARTRTRIGLAIAASVTAAALVLWSATHWDSAPAGGTAVAGVKSTVLPDGSAVDLAGGTSVAVDFTEELRLLHLPVGEAFFNVKPDGNRPFTIRVGQIQVTAVGTAFDVKHEQEQIVVTVEEGVVDVRFRESGMSPSNAGWSVASGQQLIYSNATETATLASVDTSAVLAWREGRLEYTNAPLSAVISDINQYVSYEIAIDDPAIEDLTFTGTVFTHSIDNWLQALPGALPVHVEYAEAGPVLIEAAVSEHVSSQAESER
jgi:transmembrane sensor